MCDDIYRHFGIHLTQLPCLLLLPLLLVIVLSTFTMQKDLVRNGQDMSPCSMEGFFRLPQSTHNDTRLGVASAMRLQQYSY